MSDPALRGARPVSARPPLRVAVLQSNYIPWKGYFDMIHDVDLFVFYDDVQYTNRDWRNRNKIKTASGTLWLSVPVGESRHRLVDEVRIPDAEWQSRHWQTLTQNYGKCPHFERYRTFFEDVYLGRRWESLSILNQHLIRHIATDFLGIRTRFANARDFGSEGAKMDRLLDLVRRTGATYYLSGPAAKAYIESERFAQAGIELTWKDYAGYPEYPQRFPPFDHGVTVLDLLFNAGPEAPELIWGWRSR